ncbi:hypothetical protein AB0K05_24780 [Nonomuraea sp. NPDC049486]|uniref:hypothetical protein n=1 Tax=Nonomuraea sp. NPDC049486 TaxID=3155773 RepID=UPI003432EF0C
MSAIAEWIRPWYPGGEDVKAGRFDQPPVFIGHLYPDCPQLLSVDPAPREGSGWLDPRAPGTCPACLPSREPTAPPVHEGQETLL